MTDICFHVGLGKTATTYLQNKVFPKTGALGRDSAVPGSEAIEQELSSIVCRSEPDIWTTDKGKKLANSIYSVAKNSPILYSTEYWASPPFLIPDNIIQQNHPDQLIFAEHIKSFAEHAWGDKGRVSVLLTIRNQAEWLCSYYAQRSIRFKASQTHFEEFILDLLETDDFCGAGFLEYDRVFQYIESILGEGSCTILAYEEMNTPFFWNELSRILEKDLKFDQDSFKTKENRSRISEMCWSLKKRKILSSVFGPGKMLERPWLRDKPSTKICNLLLSKVDHYLSQQDKKRICLIGSLKERIDNRFEGSNERLERLLCRKVFDLKGNMDQKGYSET